MSSRRGAGEGFFLFALALLIFLLVFLKERNKGEAPLRPGMFATVKESSMRVYTVEWVNTDSTMRCRLDNGPGTAPRYQEMTFRVDELVPITEVEKK